MMTTPQDTPPPVAQPQFQPQYAAPLPVAKQQNTIGLIGFIAAIVGFGLACIPGAIIVGRVLLPIGFTLSIVGLCLKGKTKGLSLAGLIISMLGAITSVVMVFVLFAVAFGEGMATSHKLAEQ